MASSAAPATVGETPTHTLLRRIPDFVIDGNRRLGGPLGAGLAVYGLPTLSTQSLSRVGIDQQFSQRFGQLIGIVGAKEPTATRHSWYSGGGGSFKSSMANLDNSSRKIADRHLHTHVRKKETLPTLKQVDFSNDLDVLLSEIVRILG